ncbi:MAG: AraC family transcriptional regulator [Acidobacteria bacterium]|nr:AraC family transcriptional regulator [Acidobacteriota bacterium]MCA1651218.1 AraC family transcriptional regulator [Acidobacteriota bacterium]
MAPRSALAPAAVHRVSTAAGDVRLLHGSAVRYEGGSETGAFSLKLVRRGRATWHSRGKKVTLAETMFLFLPPSTPYVVSVQSDSVVETACLFFSTTFFRELAASTLNAGTQLDGRAAPDPDWRIAACAADARLLDPLVRLVVRGPATERWRVDELLMTNLPPLFAAQVDCAGKDRIDALRAGTRDELYRRVTTGREYLLDNLAHGVSLEHAARAAAMSPFHFHRTFSSVFGRSPMRYLSERRLERAAFLLSHSRVPVTEICLSTGFESLGSFIKAFTKRFGRSPRRYRLGNAD